MALFNFYRAFLNAISSVSTFRSVELFICGRRGEQDFAKKWLDFRCCLLALEIGRRPSAIDSQLCLEIEAGGTQEGPIHNTPYLVL